MIHCLLARFIISKCVCFVASYTTDDGTLVIPDCGPEDSGRYVCTIRLITGEIATSVATITIDTEAQSTHALYTSTRALY